MKKVKKGSFGYIKSQKIRTLLLTLVLFAVPILIFVTGYIQTGTRLNLFTVIAIVGCLPACKWTVTLIMFFMQKSTPQQVYAATKEVSGDLITGFDFIFTTYEKTCPVNALVICGNQLVCYSPDEKLEPAFLEKHLSKLLTVDGFSAVQPKVMKDFNRFLQRVSEIEKKKEHYRENIPFTPDEKYPELSREELIFYTLLAISL